MINQLSPHHSQENNIPPFAHKEHIVWMDMEMTGLDPQTDLILEMATCITNSDLEIIATGPELVIHQSLDTLEAMDDWNRNHHQKSQLWNRVLQSTLTLEQAEEQTLEFIQQYTVPEKNCVAGNSIWQDRRFLITHMPRIHNHLHYRLIDVSSIKELAKRWLPHLQPYPKQNKHRAMDDIKESIEELRHFKHHIFTSS